MEFCSDRKKELTLKKLGREIRKRCHAVKSIQIVAVSGARYNDFVDQIKEDSKSGGGPYDEYVLLGGRGGDKQSEAFVEQYSKRAAQQWNGEFDSTSAEEEGFEEHAGRTGRNRWTDEEWGSWNRDGNHRRWTEEEWGACG